MKSILGIGFHFVESFSLTVYLWENSDEIERKKES